MSKKAIIIGGTGATGRKLIKQLLINDKWGKITSVGRKPVLNGDSHEKLQDNVLETLYDLSSTLELWKGHDVFFNCIGTTRKRAGSAKGFIDIELGISMEAAKMASKAKIPHASIVSASGANHNQWAKDWIHPLLYIRTIGQKEQTVLINKFDRISIFRPGMLLRLINDTTWIERIMALKRFSLRVDDLASAMIFDAEYDNQKSDKDSPKIYIGNECIKSIIKYPPPNK